jgi:hypothetical protein
MKTLEKTVNTIRFIKRAVIVGSAITVLIAIELVG